jgi:hypothetical protein
MGIEFLIVRQAINKVVNLVDLRMAFMFSLVVIVPDSLQTQAQHS